MAAHVQNLKPWPKGVSVNPGGRPKKKLITDELERLLQQQAPGDSGKTWASVIAESLLRQAAKGDVRAISELANRIEGKPLQAVDLDLNSSSEIETMTDEELKPRLTDLWKELQVQRSRP